MEYEKRKPSLRFVSYLFRVRKGAGYRFGRKEVADFFRKQALRVLSTRRTVSEKVLEILLRPYEKRKPSLPFVSYLFRVRKGAGYRRPKAI